ncbi:MAG: tetratricopeptide repeat protein [Planctomycetota bacterium]|nr:tetratricopeptide repeat protein [Planctomycetota bacterium]
MLSVRWPVVVLLMAAPALAWAAGDAPAPDAAPAAVAQATPRTCAAEAAPVAQATPDPVAQSLRHYVRGRLLATAGEHVRAVQEFRRAAALTPEVGHVWLYLGLSLYDSGDMAEAVKALDTALKFSPDDPAVLYFRARVARNAGDLKPSQELLVRLVGIAPKGTAYLILGTYHLAQVCQQLGDVDGAIAHYETLLEQFREPQGFFQRYAELFMVYRSQLQLKESLGRLYLLRGDNDKAVAIFKDILVDRPDQPEVLGLLCHAYIQKKDSPAARDVARRLIELRPDGSEGYQRLAEVYRGEGRAEGSSPTSRPTARATPTTACWSSNWPACTNPSAARTTPHASTANSASGPTRRRARAWPRP